MYTYGRLIEDFRVIAKDATSSYWQKNALQLAEESVNIFWSHRWPFHEGEDVLTTTAPYSTGTVSALITNKTITGVGTTWDTNWPTPAVLRPSGGNGDFYLVTSFDSPTTLTIDPANGWPQPSQSGMAYSLEFPSISLPSYIRFTGFCESRLTGWRNLAMNSYEAMLSARPLTPQSFWPGNYYITPSDGTTQAKIWIWPAPAEAFTIRYRYNRAMPDFRYYALGACSSNATTTITGNGASSQDFRTVNTGYSLVGQYFEFISRPMQPIAISSVTDASHFVLASAFPIAVTDSPYAISNGLLVPDDAKPLIRNILRWKYHCDEAPQLAPASELRYRQELDRAMSRYNPGRESMQIVPVGNPWGVDWGQGPAIPTILKLNP